MVRNLFDNSNNRQGPELPTVDELIAQEDDPDTLAQLVIIRDGFRHDPSLDLFRGNDEVSESDLGYTDEIIENDVRAHRRSQHNTLRGEN